MFRTSLRHFQGARAYHSVQHPSRIISTKGIDAVVLKQALTHIPKYGFDSLCITQAIRELEYPDSLVLALTSSATGDSLEFQLVKYWLQSQRQKLNDSVVEPSNEFHQISNEYERTKFLLKQRLLYNEPVAHHLSGALSQLVVPYNVQTSVGELHALADDIAFFAGDESNDFAWYTKRFGISTIYVGAELFMMQDSSPSFKATYNFVDGKVDELRNLGVGYNNVEQWSLFNAVSLVNLIKSQLTRG